MSEELFVYRDIFTDIDCSGIFVFKNEIQCYSIEDKDRELHSGMSAKEIRAVKVHGQTAIPYGRYKIILYDSPKQGERVPMLVGVKGFSFIQIHRANWATQLHGCIGPGLSRSTNMVADSRKALDKIKKLIVINGIEYINIEKLAA